MINEKPEIEFITEAIMELRPGAQFSVVGHSLEQDDDGTLKSVKWNENNILTEPSYSEILQKIPELKSKWELSLYHRKRALEYPSIGDQLDALFKAGLFPEEMAAKIQAVKEKYPKGN
jgi:hypothetical protein